MHAPTKLTPAELAALEQAFAADPSSGAYRPLSEAYLAMGRFMEAMVVCKKGVKSHPADPAPRVLLARIYAGQGKDAKALDELGQALQLSPDDAPAHRLVGVLRLKAGDRAAGTEALRKAWQAAPGDPETADAMRRAGLDPAAAPAAAPAAPVQGAAAGQAALAVTAATTTPPPVLARAPAAATPASRPIASAPQAEAPVRTPGAAQALPPGTSAVAPRPAPVEAAPPRPPVTAADAAAPTPASQDATVARPGPQAAAPAERSREGAAYADELASRYGTQEHPLPVVRGRRRGTLVATVVLGVALAAVLVGWGVSSSIRKARAVEIDRLLRQSRELIEKDTYASYKEAARLCERILARDHDAVGGHAYLAYVDAILWSEHTVRGEGGGASPGARTGDALRDEARKHLDAVAKLKREHSHAFAAQAYLRFYGGDARGAVEELQKVLAGPEGASGLVRGVLGILQLQSGDLDGARESLTQARQNAPGDVRITQMLAEQWRRRGAGFEPQASALYDAVLTRLAPDHVPSLLGKAQLLLDGGQPAEAAKRVKRVLDLGDAASPRQIAVALALRGSVDHALGRAADGDAAEKQALALDPTSGDVHDLVGRRKLHAGDAAAAAEAFQRAVQLEPARLGFYVDLASALMRKGGGARDAVAALERAGDRAGNARVTKLLGDAYRAAGEPDRARAAYEKALGMEKRYPEAHLALAAVYRDRKEWDRAAEELDRAIKDYGEGSGASAQAWLELAELEEARGAPPDRVDRAYASALRADPQSCPALWWLGHRRTERKGGAYDPKLARQMLGDYLRACPKGPRAQDAQRALAGIR